MPREQTPGRVEKHVILNEVKNPTTKVKSIYSVLFRWDISLALNMTYFFNFSQNKHCFHLRGKWRNAPIGDNPSTKNAVASRWLATAFFRLIPESFKYADYAGNQFYLIVGHPIACKGA